MRRLLFTLALMIPLAACSVPLAPDWEGGFDLGDDPPVGDPYDPPRVPPPPPCACAVPDTLWEGRW